MMPPPHVVAYHANEGNLNNKCDTESSKYVQTLRRLDIINKNKQKYRCFKIFSALQNIETPEIKAELYEKKSRQRDTHYRLKIDETARPVKSEENFSRSMGVRSGRTRGPTATQAAEIMCFFGQSAHGSWLGQ